jgi:hypothetical protein
VPPTLPHDRNRSSFRNDVFFRIPEYGQIPRTQVIPRVIHHRQNPSELTIPYSRHFSKQQLQNLCIGPNAILLARMKGQTTGSRSTVSNEHTMTVPRGSKRVASYLVQRTKRALPRVISLDTIYSPPQKSLKTSSLHRSIPKVPFTKNLEE